MLKFIGTALQNLQLFSLTSVDSGHMECPSWVVSACCQGVHIRSGGLDTLDAGCSFALSYGLMASVVLWVQSALQRWAGGDGWVGARQEQSQQGEERGTSVWAGVRGVGPGPRGRAALPGSGSGAGLSQKTPVAVDR